MPLPTKIERALADVMSEARLRTKTAEAQDAGVRTVLPGERFRKLAALLRTADMRRAPSLDTIYAVKTAGVAANLRAPTAPVAGGEGRAGQYRKVAAELRELDRTTHNHQVKQAGLALQGLQALRLLRDRAKDSR